MGGHYEPIESEEKMPGMTDSEDVSFLRPMRRVSNKPWWTTIRQHGHIISVYMVLGFSLLALITEPLWKKCDCKDPSLGSYSPAMDVIIYEDVDFGKYFAADNRSPYMEKPSREIDEMWKELYNFGLTGLTPEEASQLPEPTAHLPHDNNTYVVSLSVFHQLHCVNHLRKALYPDEYPGLWEYHEDGTVNHDTILALHWDHCVDILRQSIMCSADITPTPFYYRARDDNVYSTLATRHHCRSFDSVKEWAKDRQLHQWRWNETATTQKVG
ncbi:hypothetical protein CaCOL14_009477 [Colletotrichum acutatum]